MVNLHQLNSRAEWHLTLKIASPLHIGGSNEKLKSGYKNQGASAATISLLDLKDQEEAHFFLVPGSSLRGVTRAYLEELALAEKQRALTEIVSRLYGDIKNKNQPLPSVKGRFWIGDGRIPKAHAETKFITPIDRLTHKPLVPLSLQTVKVGKTFDVQLSVENPTSYEYGIIALLLRAFVNGEISVGSGTSRGLGRLELEKSAVTITQFGQQGLITEDQQPISEVGFSQAKQLLGQCYTRQDAGTACYTWMQFGATALQTALKKGGWT